MLTLCSAAMICDDDHSEKLRLELDVLRAVDAAHRSHQISTSLRYHILQNLFPPVSDRDASDRDFTECSTEPQRNSVVDRSNLLNRHRPALSTHLRFPS